MYMYIYKCKNHFTNVNISGRGRGRGDARGAKESSAYAALSNADEGSERKAAWALGSFAPLAGHAHAHARCHGLTMNCFRSRSPTPICIIFLLR